MMHGTISQPLSGVPEVAYQGQVGLLDVALDPKFASNKRIFFTYSEAVSTPGSEVANSNIVVARARLDEAGGCVVGRGGDFPREALAAARARGE